MTEKTCCVTGHREIPAQRAEYVKESLRAEILKAAEDGFTSFISGMADGVDLLFAELVIEQKLTRPELLLKAAVPHRGRLKTKNPLFQECLKRCDSIHIQQEEYSPDCFMKRNRYMVEQSERVIAVYDGRDRGGTLSTMHYAAIKKRELREIRV